MYEAMSEVYKVMIPVIEKNHEYKKLANIYRFLSHYIECGYDAHCSGSLTRRKLFQQIERSVYQTGTATRKTYFRHVLPRWFLRLQVRRSQWRRVCVQRANTNQII